VIWTLKDFVLLRVGGGDKVNCYQCVDCDEYWLAYLFNERICTNFGGVNK